MLELQEASMASSLWVNDHDIQCAITTLIILLLSHIGNQLLLRYDENWKALIEHYTQKKCLLMNGEEFCKSTTLKPSPCMDTR